MNYIAAALLVDKIGRRPLFLTSNGGMIVTFGAWTLAAALFNTRNDRAAANGVYLYFVANRSILIITSLSAVIAMIPLFYLTYSIAYTPMLVAYTVEILPFGIRARGFALMVRLEVGLLDRANAEVPVELCHLYWYNYQSVRQPNRHRKTGMEIRKDLLLLRSPF